MARGEPNGKAAEQRGRQGARPHCDFPVSRARRSTGR